MSSLALDIELFKLGQCHWKKAPPMEKVGIEILFFDPIKEGHVRARFGLKNTYTESAWCMWILLGLELQYQKEKSEWFDELPHFAS